MSNNPDRCYYEIVYTPEGVKSFTVSASIHGHLNGYESDRTQFNGRSQLIADVMQRGVDWQRQNLANFK